MTEYKPSFYAHLEKMIDGDSEGKGYHHCRGCGVTDGGLYYHPRGHKFEGDPKSKTKAIVRLCLIDEKSSPADKDNIGYYCTRCKKPPRESQRPSAAERKDLPRLPFRSGEIKP